MRKINIFPIIKDHLATLVDARSGRLSVVDIFTFFAFPAILAAFSHYICPVVSDATKSALIASLSVFAALLFSAQIALFGLRPKRTEPTSDQIVQAQREKAFLESQLYFSEVNSTISYLIFLSCLELFICVLFVYIEVNAAFERVVLVFLTMHFFLTLLMLLKRAHIVFAATYRER